MVLGVIDYGIYIPRLRIKAEEYIKVWSRFSARGVKEKAVMDLDEDVMSMALESAEQAVEGVDLRDVKVLAFASTSPPYSERLLSSFLVEGLGLNRNIFTSEHISSTRSGTEALISCINNLKSIGEGLGLVVVSDSPSASMKDTLEHGLGASSASFLIGFGDVVAEFEGASTHVAEFPGERFRPRGSDRIKDLELRGYYLDSFHENVSGSVKLLLDKLGRRSSDYSYFIIQQFNGVDPLRVALKLGFTINQLKTGFLAPILGDTGACSALIGFLRVLECAEPQEKILIASYGSGAGSDALSFKLTRKPGKKGKVSKALNKREYIDYLSYLKLKDAII